MTFFSVYIAYMASSDSRFGLPDVNLRYRLETMIDELERGPNSGLRAFMMKMGWQPPASELVVKDFLHDPSIKIYGANLREKSGGCYTPVTPFDNLNPEYQGRTYEFRQ